ncbi:class I SAM-dependent methyltransferase [Nakamurella antarctica]|uniref:Class I SAM-dependent methyltransferase n=2 Tax=Nakamurella antarctica TaxID=1902245 RepID=A0A3G8ZSC1_9ACTN|nr:class I SAM-dependent methyltransferase [Nakamurella antarctica]
MSAVHPSDQQLVATWADSLEGDAIDAGCGPGHWTDFLSERGVAARGIDQVPEFVESACSTYPSRAFLVGNLETLDASTCSVGGVLAWYSLIHHEPDKIHIPLHEFHRVLRPGGGLLVGFFEGATVEKFAHAVFPAYRWPVSAFSEKLRAVGFDVIETHARSTAGQRPHGAIQARRRGRP